jgi:hypothetical protein
LKQLISQTIINLFSTYYEVLRTGGIQSSATGDKVMINYQANICGDIIIFMGPRRQSNRTGLDLIEHVQELVLSDNTLKQKNELALESLHQKFQMLMVLPKMFAILISAFLSFIVYWKAAYIQEIFNYQLDIISFKKVVPLAILLISVIFSKFFGFKIISGIMWVVNFFRRITLRLKDWFQ